MLFTGYKLKDTIADSRFPLPARLLYLFYSKHFRKAAARLQTEDGICAERMGELRRLEGDGDGKLGVTEVFGGMLACLSLFYEECKSACVPDVCSQRAAHSLFDHLGRWITLIDAAEDTVRDAKSGSYNALTAAGISREEAFVLMAREQEQVLAAFDLLPENDFTVLTHNILSFGLQARGHEIYKRFGGVSDSE
jgi:hypothetical protein